MPEPPRLYDLIRPPDARTKHSYWILQCDHGDRRRQQERHESDGFGLLSSSVRPVDPTVTARGEVRAWRMRDHQIPTSAGGDQLTHVSLIVWPAIGLRWQQVARPCVVAACDESIADAATEFARHEDTQLAGQTRSEHTHALAHVALHRASRPLSRCLEIRRDVIVTPATTVCRPAHLAARLLAEIFWFTHCVKVRHARLPVPCRRFLPRQYYRTLRCHAQEVYSRSAEFYTVPLP